MFSTWNSVASSGGDAMTMSRSSSRIRCTHSIVFLALAAGSTVKTWSYLFLKYRASLARRPARASATGDDSRPTVETVLKSTAYAMPRKLPQRRCQAAQRHFGVRARLRGRQKERQPRVCPKRCGHEDEVEDADAGMVKAVGADRRQSHVVL